MNPADPSPRSDDAPKDISAMMNWALGADDPTEIISTVTTRDTARPAADNAGAIIGPFTLVRPLGHGGFGEVWEAAQYAPLRRTVALKLIKPGMASADVMRRFDAERQALAMMDHPNIARVFDAGATPDGRPWFAMELVDGSALTTYCDRKRLTIRQRLDLFIKVCAAVQHAHQKAVLHRDLKPSNILVSEVDGQPVPKVIDFGIAKALEQSADGGVTMTLQGQFIGTPQYMSPEQMGGDGDVDTRSDVYALGVILYELLTGRPMIDPARLRKAAVGEICRIIREEDPVRPSTCVANLDEETSRTSAELHGTDTRRWTRELAGELDWIVMRALAKERERRYQGTDALADDIRRYLNLEPVEAGPPKRHYRAWKFIRRNKSAVASLSVVLLSIIVAAIVAMVQQARSAALLRQAARTDRLIAQEMFVEGRSRDAFAYLARSLQYDPSTTLAAETAVYAMNTNAERLPVHVLAGHEGGVAHAEFSADGRWIVTDGLDDTVRLWDAVTGAAVLTLPVQTPRAHFTRFSPDSKTIITHPARASHTPEVPDYGARILDVPGGVQLRRLDGHPDYISSVECSADGRLILTVCYDNSTRLWNGSDGRLLEVKRHDGEIQSARLSPDGGRIALIAEDGTAKIRTSLVKIGLPGPGLRGSDSKVAWIDFPARGVRCFNADLARCVALSQDGSPPEIVSEKGVVARLQGVQGAMSAASFSPDGSRVALIGTLASGKTALFQVWDAASGELLSTTQVARHGRISALEFSPDGRHVVTACEDGSARIWDGEDGELVAALEGHEDKLHGARFSPDGRLVLTASADGTARVWENHSGSLLSARAPATPPPARKIAPAVSGRRWSSFPISAPLDWDGDVIALNADNTQGIEIMRDGEGWSRLRLIEYPRMSKLRDFAGHQAEVRCAQFSADGRWLVSGSTDKTARVWSIADGSLRATLAGHLGRVSFATFSADARRVLTGSTDRTLRLWDAADGTALATMRGHKGALTQAIFSPDGRRVASLAENSSIRVWDLADGGLVVGFGGQDGNVDSISWGDGGQEICVSGVDDGGPFQHTWECVRADEPVPEWFGEFLRLLAGRQISATGELGDLSPAEWSSLHERVRQAALSGTGRYTEIARWFFSPREEKDGCANSR